MPFLSKIVLTLNEPDYSRPQNNVIVTELLSCGKHRALRDLFAMIFFKKSLLLKVLEVFPFLLIDPF